MLKGYFCREKKKKKYGKYGRLYEEYPPESEQCNRGIEENSGTETRKSRSIVCAEQWQQDIICLVFWDTEQKEVSDPGSHTVLFSLPLFLICLFIQVYLWRGSARKLCSRARIWYFMLCFLFWTKFFPSMEELQQFLHAIGSREMNSELCTLLIWQGKGCFIYAIWKQDIVRAQQIKYPFAFFFFFCSLSHNETTQNYFQLSLPSYIYE